VPAACPLAAVTARVVPPALVIAAASAAVASITDPFGMSRAGEVAVAGSVTATVVTTRLT
jgi:hypothetical protein